MHKGSLLKVRGEKKRGKENPKKMKLFKKIKEQINMEKIKWYKEINEVKSCFLEKMNKIGKFLARLIVKT